MRKFNITGKCIPDRHYMVDISDRIERIKGMGDSSFEADEKMADTFYDQGVKGMPQFIEGGKLNMPLILERFCHTYSDLVIDYLGLQYIIEMKIWHGQAYNDKGEIQLVDYLKSNDKTEGYMLTFNFNKTGKQTSSQQVVDGKTITEFVV